MKRPPTIARLRQLLSVDAESGKLFWNVDQGRGRAGAEAFTSRVFGYGVGSIDGIRLRSHRVAFALYHGRWPYCDIDHINGVRDDNRPSNLREVTRSENARNCAVFSSNSSGTTGVRWHKASGKWIAYIYEGAKQTHLGLYESKAEAIGARKAAEADRGFHENHGRPSNLRLRRAA